VSQLELFSGPHLPMMRCLASLEGGDVQAACEALGGVASADRDRLAALAARLPAARAAREVHAAFEAALLRALLQARAARAAASGAGARRAPSDEAPGPPAAGPLPGPAGPLGVGHWPPTRTPPVKLASKTAPLPASPPPEAE